MFSVNSEGIKGLEEDLKAFKLKALPFATKNTVNAAAFAAQKTARVIVKNRMIQRNKFTVRSIQVDQARTLSIPRQAAVVGSTADYMEDQEFGGTKTKGGKKGVSIATSYSAGQSDSSRPRRKLPRKPNKLENIRLRHRRSKGKNRRQKNLIAVKQAAASGNKYVYLDLKRTKGIFRVLGGKRRPRVKMVHNLSKQSVDIPANPWLVPAVIATERKIPKIYKESLEFQLKRHGLFRG